MNYNIHPVFVHFPIALLFLYSLIKLVPLKKWFPKIAWRDIGIFLLVIGLLGAGVALLTGDTAEHLTHPPRPLVEMHSFFATIATYLYGALLLGELIALFRPSLFSRFHLSVAMTVLALVALITILTTGLLGGTIVYGTTADPLAAPVLHILGLQ